MPATRAPLPSTPTMRPPTQMPPTQTTTASTVTGGGVYGHPTGTGAGGPGAVQLNPDGTVKGVGGLQVDPAAPTELDQSIIEDYSKLAAIVVKLGGSDAEAQALYTTPGTWSNANLSHEEASVAKLEGLTPTEFAVRKGLRALRDAVVNGGSDPGNATIIVKPPAPIQVPPSTGPGPLPGAGGNPINVNVQGTSNMNTALLAIGGGLAVYLISKMG